jgi:hypothetical protein
MRVLRAVSEKKVFMRASKSHDILNGVNLHLVVVLISFQSMKSGDEGGHRHQWLAQCGVCAVHCSVSPVILAQQLQSQKAGVSTRVCHLKEANTHNKQAFPVYTQRNWHGGKTGAVPLQLCIHTTQTGKRKEVKHRDQFTRYHLLKENQFQSCKILLQHWVLRMPFSGMIRHALRLLVTANVVPSSLILVSLMM